jgi:hypothetical protein
MTPALFLFFILTLFNECQNGNYCTDGNCAIFLDVFFYSVIYMKQIKPDLSYSTADNISQVELLLEATVTGQLI